LNKKETDVASTDLGDFFEFDPILLNWREISRSSMTNSIPSARESFGFACVGRKLYVFGGKSAAGNPRILR
jgi:hypothetical protein